MNLYLNALRRYAVFEGRSTRQEYWLFVLINVLIQIAAFTIASFTPESVAIVIMLAYAAYVLITLVPSIAVTVRRLHDMNRSGWWILIALFPFVGGIVLLVFLATEGDLNANKYGPNPLLRPVSE